MGVGSEIPVMCQGGWGYKDENGDHLIVNHVSINAVNHAWFTIDQPELNTILW